MSPLKARRRKPMSTQPTTRRELLQRAGVFAASAAFGGLLSDAWGQEKQGAPTAPVAIARCDNYDLALVTQRLSTMLDQAGGLKKLVAGKTVAIKVNLTGSPLNRALGLSAGRTFH